MIRTIRLKVDESLQAVLERIRKEIAENLKKEYGLNEVTVYGTLASQVAAAKLSGKTLLNFKIEKVGLNKGVLKLIG